MNGFRNAQPCLQQSLLVLIIGQKAEGAVPGNGGTCGGWAGWL